ncbi:MAG: hypothetical protein HZA90_05185 [Verrucomicrobia bacterium]|nr:hypothetical protein [Verrucomicrobiota bacterium]
MNTVAENRPLTMAEKLELAQAAYDKFRSSCFWYLRDDVKVTEDDLETIIRGLRSNGNREAFLIAGKLCR